ncbi:glycoside hydrolase family 23 protein [Karstenula rhodostoma CBS 690.94]|uniref:Glycoside hydrolase family 23 protein n=1 Tax=Karstenula rhodostoma CBS 690.94 TaxID=1392251 RepID=A0A9P4PFR6_9PLEO|nr:glycoside hydrolase family 23 protein [Karstenula rhodostoma CBS 690.94]
MTFQKTILQLAACSAIVYAQSASIGLGTNPDAQGATEEVTPGAGPNGSEDWLNSGMEADGWTAPFLSWDSLIKIDRKTFYANAGSACEQYDWAFQQAGDKHQIDPVFLAFIAMQESSCNADAGGPTPGLMQVACENYPDGQCTNDVAKNVDAGAAFLRNQLDSNNNNAIKVVGNYNGWFTAGDQTGLNGGRGLSLDYPCSDDGKAHGQPQNLDYLQQTLNGWFLGLNPYGDDNWLGQYHCSGDCGSGHVC